MKCSSCGLETRINWGNAYVVLCEKCSEGFDPTKHLVPTKHVVIPRGIELSRLSEADELYILNDAEQEGPYSPSQLKQMWKNGQIKMNNMIWYSGVEYWLPAKEVFAEVLASENVKHGSNLTLGGFAILAIGIAVVCYFVLFFDTSVATNISSSIVPSRVENIGLLQTRQNGIIVGVALSIIGSMFIGVGHLRKQ
jgi:hypothetical protein